MEAFGRQELQRSLDMLLERLRLEDAGSPAAPQARLTVYPPSIPHPLRFPLDEVYLGLNKAS